MDSSVQEMFEDTSLAAEGLNSVIADMTPRRQVQAVLEERWRFETFLADLSAAFVRVPANALHDHIQDGLQQLVKFLAIDCSTLASFSRSVNPAPVVFVCRPGVHHTESKAMDAASLVHRDLAAW